MMKIGLHTDKQNTRGDTIVEVLISVTIISFVLGAAYLLTSQSLQAGLAARERTEALNYVQGQIERLKSAKEQLSQTDFNNTYHKTTAAESYCLVIDPATNTVTKKLTSDTNKVCSIDPDHPNGGNDARYRLSTTYISSGANAETFKFSANWERVGKATPESADIYYRAAP